MESDFEIKENNLEWIFMKIREIFRNDFKINCGIFVSF